MFVYDATNRLHDNGTTNIRDLPVLDAIDRLSNVLMLIVRIQPASSPSSRRFLLRFNLPTMSFCMRAHCGIYSMMSAGKATTLSSAMPGFSLKELALKVEKVYDETWSMLPSIHSRWKFVQCFLINKKPRASSMLTNPT